ncbi:MAG: Rossmann-like and DUF2520 domain-containing protein [Acidobacteriota bacterium]
MIPPSKQQKPRIAIIGPGRLGQTLLRALLSRRERVVAVGARKRRSAPRLSLPVDSNLARVAQSADIVLITVRDDDIARVVKQISRGSSSLCGVVAMHCSGVLASTELAPLRELGAAVGSFHPLQTFVLPPAPPSIFRETTFHFEGDRRAKRAALYLARALGAGMRSLRPRDKVLYHAAAAFVSNYQVSIFEAAIELLEACGFERAHSRKLLLPLARGTLGSLAAHDPRSALTGPISRGDLRVVRMHVDSLRDRAPDLLPAYATLGLLAARLARRRRTARREIDRIVALLKSVEKRQS